MRQRSRRAVPTRRTIAETSGLRRDFAFALHRRPCRWDVLVFELAVALATTCTQVRVRMLRQPLKIKPDLTDGVGAHLARGFELFVQQWLWGRPESLSPIPNLLRLDAEAAKAIATAAGSVAYEPLLRKYAEDVQDELLPRPDRDVTTFSQSLADATERFLATRCIPGGDLFDALNEPLAADGGYFPNNDLPSDPARSTGNPALELRLLALRIHPSDKGDDIKGKLIHFCRTDPWLSTELSMELAEAREGIYKKFEDTIDPDEDEDSLREEIVDELTSAEINTTDQFCFTSTSLDGRTPIDLLIDRQPDLDSRQRAHLERWNNETFYGAFHVKKSHGDELLAVRIGNEREYRLVATRKGVAREIKPGTLLLTRAVPWNDHWLLSGGQTAVPAEKNLDLHKVRDEALRMLGNRLFDPGAPELQKAWTLQYEYHQCWMELFGTEELQFDNVRDMRAAMQKFGQTWQTRPGPDGLSPTQKYEQLHGKPAPADINFAAILPQELEEKTDLAIVFDRQAGLLMLSDYIAFREALTAGSRASPGQARLILEWLREESIDPCLFERARRELPPKDLEAAMRLALRDQLFQLDRDFDRLLRKYKGETLRQPRRPFIALVSAGDDET